MLCSDMKGWLGEQLAVPGSGSPGRGRQVAAVLRVHALAPHARLARDRSIVSVLREIAGLDEDALRGAFAGPNSERDAGVQRSEAAAAADVRRSAAVRVWEMVQPAADADG